MGRDRPGREGLFDLIAEHVEDGYMVYDREQCRIVYANPACEQIFGCAREIVHGRNSWAAWTHDDDRDEMSAAYQRYLKGDPFDEVHRIVRVDEQVRWVRTRAFHMDSSSEPGQPARDIVVVQDVTSERELEDELRHAQKMEAMGALASGVAHDFNNVLQAILGCLHLVQKGELRSRSRFYLDRAADAARRGGALATQLMGFARKQQMVPKPVEVDVVVEEAVTLIERLMTEMSVVDVELGASARRVIADEVQIEQILLNLAANARDAMPDGGRLTIRSVWWPPHRCGARTGGVTGAEGCIELTVQDSGVGMDDGVKSRIFEPFFTTKEVGHGTGLGLSTVFAVVSQLRGQLEVESQPGQGTAFHIFLPCAARTAPEIERSFQLPRIHGKTLLVEDEPLVRLTIRHYLEELGLEVVDARDADEVEQLGSSHEDLGLLISDVVLPGMRGTKLAERLRCRHPDLPALFISADPEAAAVDEPVLAKPFRKDELLGALASLLGSSTDAADLEADRQERHPGEAREVAGDLVARPPEGPTVLIVDDDSISRELLGEILRGEGYRVVLAAGPPEAEAAVGAGDIDVLLTDVRLDGATGDALAARLVAARPDLPVVFMSGDPEPPPGASAFLQKPLELSKLLGVLDGAVQARLLPPLP